MCRMSLLLAALLNASVLVSGLQVQVLDSGSHVVPLDDLFGDEQLGDENDLMAASATRRTRGPGGRKGLPMRRIRLEQAALEKKLLQQELKKLPFSQRQLGEGVAMRSALQKEEAKAKGDFVEKSFSLVDRWKNAEKKLKVQKTKFAQEKTKLEKDAAKAKEKLSAMKDKLKNMIPNNKLAKIEKKDAKDKKKAEKWKKKASKLAGEEKQEKVEAEKKVAKAKADESKIRQDSEKKVEQGEEKEVEQVAAGTEDVKKKYYVNMIEVNTWKKKITENEGKMKDLKSKIKDLQKRGTQTKSALALKEKQDLNALQAKDTKKLAKEKVKEKGLVQKLEWDKRKVNKAKTAQKKEATVMAAALGRNDKLKEDEKSEASKLKVETQSAHLKELRDTGKLNQVKISEAVEREEAKESTERIENIRSRAAEKVKERKEEGDAGVQSAKDDAAQQVNDLKSKVAKLEDKVQSVKNIEASDVQKDVTKQMMGEQADELKMENTLKAVEDEEQQTLKAKVKDDEKVTTLKAKLEDEHQHEAALIAKEKEDTAGMEQVLAKDEKSLKKRVGSRQVAAVLQQNLDAKSQELKKTEKELQAQQKQLQTLTDSNSALEKTSTQYKHKFDHAQYRVAVKKEKLDQLDFEYQKLKVKHALLKQQKGGGGAAKDLGEAGAARDMYENKYKVQIKVGAAADKEVELLKARAHLLYTQSSRAEAKAQRIETEKEEEIKHGQRVADAVRAKWSTKLVNEEVKHSKTLMKMKHKLEGVELKSEKKLVKADKKLDREKIIANKAENEARNERIAGKFTTEMVGRQQVKAGEMRAYVKNMEKLRHRYNKQYQTEYETEIKKLQRKVEGFKNKRLYVKMQYKILKLQQRLKEAHHSTGTQQDEDYDNYDTDSSSSKLRGNRGNRGNGGNGGNGIHQQSVDLGTMLAAAIKRVDKKAAHMTVEEQRKRLSAAVNAIVAYHTVHQQTKANRLVDAALSPIKTTEQVKLKDVVKPKKEPVGNTKLGDATMAQNLPALQESNSYTATATKWKPPGSSIEVATHGQMQELKVGALLFNGNEGGSSV